MVHEFSLFMLSKFGKLIPRNAVNDSQKLSVKVAGLSFPNRIGLAAGMDKACVAPYAWQGLGFGFVEVGTITNLPQEGNPKPRLFRLPNEKSLLNRMGFNNAGASAIAKVLAKLRNEQSFQIPLGINIGKSRLIDTKDTEAVIQDYLGSLNALQNYADYIAINVSSPNTPGLREWQSPEQLKELLAPIKRESHKPVFLKISPDLQRDSLDQILEVAATLNIEGIIATNTTISRQGAPNWAQGEAGGVSGELLKHQSLKITEWIMQSKPKDMALISVGGISSLDDIKQRLDLGVDLVQVYSALVFEGPSLISDLNLKLLKSFS